MKGWLDGLARALDAAPRPVEFFFRDDDAGWLDERLLALIDLFARRGLPLDVAAIPCAVSPALASELRARVVAAPRTLGVHQHGFAHANHETEGRKCEFGAARAAALQRQDIELGRRLLAEVHGLPAGDIFTPPWNRCAAATGECLVALGFRVLSRDVTATPLNLTGLYELPVCVDWFAKRKGARLSVVEVGEQLAERARANYESKAAPVGVMLHHAEMDEGEMLRADELLDLVASHANARARLMSEFVTAAHGRAALSFAGREPSRAAL